ncbi:hypothetical protein V6Z11_D13G048800 [Gossypium hirsutum]|uniref:Uncharacterized protein n=1 Tax=Gossypium tomentosum TaxID=34277 RepID=A0A5D2HUT7_GOSTO|nr:hypothetical protein ES332_D13G048900v1 [Gossypium tomentosum]
MGVHILPFFEKDVGRKAHINLYLLKVILLILLHMVIQASAAKGFLSSCI